MHLFLWPYSIYINKNIFLKVGILFAYVFIKKMDVDFYDEIKFETIELETARDVVLFSFIVQKSLTCLDLSVCESTLYQKVIFLEEQCRKLVEPRRQILYTYHLDLPDKLEQSLRAVVPNADDRETSEAFHLGVIYVYNGLHNRDLANCVINPIMSARNTIEKLRKYLKVMKLLNFNEFRGTAMLLFDKLILALYPNCTDSKLIVEFAETFRFETWLLYSEDPNLVGYVLQHSVQIRKNICQVSESLLDPINGCIMYHSTKNIWMLLNYGTVLFFHPEIYLEALGRLLNRRLVRRILRKKVPHHRLFLMLQLFYYFTFNKKHWQGLLYIWRSIPVPCLSESEIHFLFENVISHRRLRNMIEYYEDYIIEETGDMDKVAPRPLQHLCRVAVRSALACNYQLPHGIEMLVIPRLIRDYLNLKC